MQATAKQQQGERWPASPTAQAYLEGNRLTLRRAKHSGLINASPSRAHSRTCTFARLHSGISEAANRVRYVFEQRTPARQSLPTESKLWLSVVAFSPWAAVPRCQTMCECYLPLMGPQWVIFWRMATLRNGCFLGLNLPLGGSQLD